MVQGTSLENWRVKAPWVRIPPYLNFIRWYRLNTKKNNMLHFVQTPIPKKRQAYIGLIAIYGIGQQTSKNLLASLGVLNEARGIDLRAYHQLRLKAIFNDFPRLLGAELKNLVKTNIQRLININSYRGRRHKNAYPVRGQRRHTNAKTQKKLYRRWLINTYEKPKISLKGQKKVQTTQKAKKGEKKKKPTQKAITKAPKYKI